MKKTQYKNFSWNTHRTNFELEKPSICQFELTFKCDFHCRHCYTDCYNKPDYAKTELGLEKVKSIIDKIYDAGIIWLCFTGGDPLVRKDFLHIYRYAKKKGFIVTIFTNGYSMDKRIAGELKDNPPFVVEITLNAASREVYEKISRKHGSFSKTMQGIDLILSSKIPLKIKTQVTKDNLAALPKTEQFIRSLGQEFRPSFDLFPRLNGDLAPCSLRVAPKEIFRLSAKMTDKSEEGCLRVADLSRTNTKQWSLFRCAIGSGDGLHVDPRGNSFACNLIRTPAFNLLKFGVKEAINKSLSLIRNRQFKTDSKCKDCSFLYSCRLCPGRAYLETKNLEAPLDHYCELAQLCLRLKKEKND